jgi:coproporphyrinogen III oxidase-like Fe-S oxidoreductase
VTYAGYIIGFPGDTPESVRDDIEIIKRELPLDILEFFCLTPLPGSEDHKVLWQKGAWMDADMNKYDGEHVVADHPKMSKKDWEQTYQNAWRDYYTPEHMETILRRGAATSSRRSIPCRADCSG